ncbi:MAG: hypothetical protein KAT58_01705 [candidate division Zixibacteria bacterium]|nr:hypothetical protein [candidate division Zixibacteria bacterium]
MISSAEFFEEVTSDRLHGASQLYVKFLSLFKTYLQQAETISDDFCKSLSRAIVAVRSDMAPFYYAALRVSQLAAKAAEAEKDRRQQLCDLVDQLQKEWEAAIGKILDNVREILESTKSVMLHSNSSTVTTVVRELLDRKTKLYLSDARPELEGEKLGEELALAGFKVTLFPDDAKYHYVRDVDLILLGADWVSERSFTNKIGTNCLALAAVNESKPVVVVADGSKLVPDKFRTTREINQVRLAKNLYREVPLFEEIDNQLVDFFVTDQGVFKSGEMSAFVETRTKYLSFSLK